MKILNYYGKPMLQASASEQELQALYEKYPEQAMQNLYMLREVNSVRCPCCGETRKKYSRSHYDGNKRFPGPVLYYTGCEIHTYPYPKRRHTKELEKEGFSAYAGSYYTGLCVSEGKCYTCGAEWETYPYYSKDQGYAKPLSERIRKKELAKGIGPVGKHNGYCYEAYGRELTEQRRNEVLDTMLLDFQYDRAYQCYKEISGVCPVCNQLITFNDILQSGVGEKEPTKIINTISWKGENYFRKKLTKREQRKLHYKYGKRTELLYIVDWYQCEHCHSTFEISPVASPMYYLEKAPFYYPKR